MAETGAIRPSYLAAWRHVLVGWLGWSEERLAAWVGAWEDRIARNNNGWGDWFYHEDELHYVLRLLVPDDLADRLVARKTRRMHNDLAELLDEELRPAITGRPHDPSWDTDQFDWAAAKRRAEEVMAGHGVRLPDASEVNAYERRMLGP